MIDEEEKLFQRSFLTRANIINKFATYSEVIFIMELCNNLNFASSKALLLHANFKIDLGLY